MNLKASPADRERIEKIIARSNYFQSLNMKIRDLSEGSCVLSLAVRDEHTNFNGTAHGGILPALADSACGVALLSTLKRDKMIVTQSLSISYLRPAKKCELTSRAGVLNIGRKSAVVEADIFDSGGVHVAHAHSILAIRGDQ